MYKAHGEIQEHLRTLAEQISTEAGSPLVFGHLCWGEILRSGVLRLTHVVPCHDTLLHTLAAGHPERHEQAFRQHIRRSGRAGTLYDWLVRWMHACGATSPVFRLLVDPNQVEPLTWHAKASASRPSSTCSVSTALALQLMPLSEAELYLECLYRMAAPDRSTTEDQHGGPDDLERLTELRSDFLVGTRYQAWCSVRHSTDSATDLRSLGAYYDRDDSSPDENDWRFLGALQTGLLYASSVMPRGLDMASRSWGFVSVGQVYTAIKPVADTSVAQERHPLLFVSVVFPTSCGSGDGEDLAGCADSVFGKHQAAIQTSLHHTQKKIDQLPETSGSIHNPLQNRHQLESSVKEQITAHAFPSWATSLSCWAALIIEELRGTVHEGLPLSFAFCLADRTQVMDSGLFDLVDLQWDAQEPLVPWDNEGDTNEEIVSKRLREIKHAVSKKNYSWFVDGRFALLWDVTFPSQYPQSLIRLRGSSWEVFIDQTRMGRRSPAAEAVVAMAYLQQNGTGGFIVRGEHVLSFRRSSPWHVGRSQHLPALTDAVIEAITQWDLPADVAKHTADRLARALLIISDDPHCGCMLVLLKRGRLDAKFRCMGDPWATCQGGSLLDMARDQLTAQMSMDGATCVYVDGTGTIGTPSVVFRRLVGASGGTPFKVVDENGEEVLDGEGSRKWSAANAAGHKSVAVVLTVSQDGPIYIFKRQNSSPIRIVTTVLDPSRLG